MNLDDHAHNTRSARFFPNRESQLDREKCLLFVLGLKKVLDGAIVGQLGMIVSGRPVDGIVSAVVTHRSGGVTGPTDVPDLADHVFGAVLETPSAY